MKKHFAAQRFYMLSAYIVIVLGLLLTAYSSYNSYSSQREFLRQRVAGLASALPRDVISTLDAEESDLGTANYSTLKTTLQNIAESNPDIRFIYVTKERNNTVYFVADSEPEGSEDESPPGQSYDEVDESYQQAHQTVTSSVIGPTSDRWGTWISGVSTITDGGQIIGVLGMDIPAGSYTRNVVVSGLIVLIPTALIAAVFLIASSRVRQRDKDIVDRLKLVALVTNSVRTPLEGVKWASQELISRQNVTSDPESARLARELGSSIGKVVESVNDIINVAQHTETESIERRQERVDVVALVIDTVDRFKLNTSTKKVFLLLGDSWPASYVVDSNLVEMDRLITALIVRSIDKTAVGGSAHFNFIADQKGWTLQISGPDFGLIATDNDETLAIITLLVEQLGGRLTASPTTNTEINITFPLKGTELSR